MSATSTEKLTDPTEPTDPMDAVTALRLLAENERLRDRVLDLEARLAILCGSLARRAVMPEDDQPDIIHDVPPSAPR